MDSEGHTQKENIEYWNARAAAFHGSIKSTINDVYLREREVEQTAAYLARLPHARVLDAGCGTGFATMRYAMRFPEASFRGEDLAEAMIQFAQESLQQVPHPPTNLSYALGDITAIVHENASFDAVTTCRVVINLMSVERQYQALCEIHRILKPGGAYVMLESCKQSYQRLNSLREEYGLAPLVAHPMNIYIDEDLLCEWCKGLFTIEEVNPFSSSYYIGSRVAYPLILGPEGKPSHEHPVNKLFARLASVEDYGREKIFLLRKSA